MIYIYMIHIRYFGTNTGHTIPLSKFYFPQIETSHTRCDALPFHKDLMTFGVITPKSKILHLHRTLVDVIVINQLSDY